MRAPRSDEAQAVTDLVVACDVHELGAPDFELDDLLTDWNMPGFDLALDAVVVEEDGRLVAYAAFIRNDYVDVYVHPDHRNRGLGTRLLEWSERRGHERTPPGEEVRLGQVVTSTHEGARLLLESRGYAPVRTYWRMTMPLEERPPPPAWPEGVVVRTFDQERDTRAVFALVQDAFGDNERHTAESFEEWQAFMIDREAFEPGLWFIAESKGEIVGCVLCPNYEDEGWIRQLAVVARLAPPRPRHRAAPPGHVRVQPPRPQGARPRRRLVEPHGREGALRAGGDDRGPRARSLREDPAGRRIAVTAPWRYSCAG